MTPTGLLKSIAIGTLGTVVTSDIIEAKMKNYDTDIQPPIDKVSIIMASYNEEAHIEQAVSSVRNQSILDSYPEYFEFILVDSGSTDNTVKFAKPFVDKIINVPRGKLTARNLATGISNGNIIVSVDADAFYPYHWLNTLLKPFNDPSIIAVHGSSFDSNIPIIGGMIYIILHAINRNFIAVNQMNGGNSAYYKHLYYLTGRFNENIDQFNINEMLQEEEIGFGNRLAKVGKVIYKINASRTHLGGQKIACRIGLENKDACAKYGIGNDRF